MIQTVDNVKFTFNVIRVVVIRLIRQLIRHDAIVDNVENTSNAIHLVMIQLTPLIGYDTNC